MSKKYKYMHTFVCSSKKDNGSTTPTDNPKYNKNGYHSSTGMEG